MARTVRMFSAMAKVALWQLVAIIGLFLVGFVVGREGFEHPENVPDVVPVILQFLMERVLLQPMHTVWGEDMGCGGMLLNSALRGIAGGVLAEVVWAVRGLRPVAIPPDAESGPAADTRRG